MSDFDLEAAERRLARYRPLDQSADYWRHAKSGGVYAIVSLALREIDGEPMVVYRRKNGTTTWVRTAKEFFDGRFVPAD